jgi:drug/metabolite transporter (DMT)-like permease
MRKHLVYSARFFMMIAYLAWVAGLLATWLIVIPDYTDLLEEHTDTTYPLIYALLAWLGVTALIISIWVAVKGYQWIGKWEIEEEEEDEGNPS